MCVCRGSRSRAVVFFFQAEDGIRDLTVTGVQTCALPISLKSAKLKPVRLETKEGLALINGTDGMLGMLVLACADAELLFRTADVTAAMSAEALLGTDRAFQSRLHELRPHAGQIASASNLEKLMRGSQIVTSHRHSQHAVQDSRSEERRVG